MPKRLKKKVGEGSSRVTADLWKLEFSARELGRQVTMVDSSQDHNTSVALARAILLPNDVVAFN